MFKRTVSLLLAALMFCCIAVAQKKDSTAKKEMNRGIFSKNDPNKLYNPRIATYRSAVLPGWGQYTNKKYWKIPIVYAALGVTSYIFVRNIRQYNEAKKAYSNAIDGNTANDFEIPQPYYTVRDQPERIRNFRNQVRQNVDYTVLFFILFWGLNVADAAVDANLKTFDVSDDLSLRIKAGHSQMAGMNGVSLVLDIGKSNSKVKSQKSKPFYP